MAEEAALARDAESLAVGASTTLDVAVSVEESDVVSSVQNRDSAPATVSRSELEQHTLRAGDQEDRGKQEEFGREHHNGIEIKAERLATRRC